jgi:bifunctional non-homologous end joining protein LigD
VAAAAGHAVAPANMVVAVEQRGEPARVTPSRRKKAPAKSAGTSSGRRQSKQPLVTVAKAEHKREALEGLERWKARHPEAAARLLPEDVLVDAMRGRSSTWTRIRVNLKNVPEAERPAEEPPDPDYDPWRGFRPPAGEGRRSRAPKTRSSS